ncbi:DNA translocase FtsK [Neobacillus sp. YIM B06451]|uniref:DNA translocase FtsK n=1 Tax=Neobacillus sp. YIM B06451 TaxID=3070994 RepID=UPI00292F43D2|nr:DNA translocase FtsK [Neobacillus sp. YIM B06451]
MRFIKNLYRRLLNNPGEPAVEEVEVQAQAPVRNLINKEIEPKIIYDYPKGNFRFPLIPDDKRPVERKPPLQEKAKNTKVNPQREQPVKKQEKPQKKVRPFTPTEVPSPIYGYSKPAKKEKVEYELSGFLAIEEDMSDNPPNKKETLSDAAQPMDWQNERVLPHDAHVPQRSLEENGAYIHCEPSTAKEITEPIVGAPKIPEEIEQYAFLKHEQAQHQDDGKPSFDKNERGPLSENEQLLMEKEVLHILLKEGQVELNGENKPLNEPIQAIPADNVEGLPNSTTNSGCLPTQVAEAGEEMIPPPAEIKSDVISGPAEWDKTGVISEPANEDKTDVIFKPSAGEKVEGNSEPAAILSATKTEAPDTKPASEKNSTAGRSHLPFNVLMLKQDKRKLEENRRKKNQDVHSISRSDKSHAHSEREKDDSGPGHGYTFPGLELLNPPVKVEGDPGWLEARRKMLDETLFNFNVGAKVVNVTQGPSVTRFEVHPEPGVKVNKVTNLADDIKLSLAARDIRIEAPIPGKHTIGIEVPNPTSRPVLISEIIESHVFRENASPLTAVLGLDISGKPIVTDLKKMPHGLIAGATGSGKSVCINSILVSLLYKASPDDLKLLLIDPKMVELAPYNRIPHLVSPVITDVKAATASLKWAVEEMERRYELFAHAGVRDINRFNELALETKRYSEKLPFIVIIIDELADLMMMSPADVEEAICRIAQKARACGIHLIIATQRPSVDVITGLIKANVPTRIAFSVSSQIDSRTIIDIGGAERLLGRGDMLFLENGSSKPVRLQGTFVSDSEIDKVVSFAREQRSPEYLFEQEELLKKAQVTEEEDELFYEACEFVVEQGGASTSSLQRRFKVGYNRAARLIDMMEEAGFISGARGSKPRDVLITEADLESMQEAGPVHY